VVDAFSTWFGVKAMRDSCPSELIDGNEAVSRDCTGAAAQPEAVLYDEPTTMVDPLMPQLLGDLIPKTETPVALDKHRRYPRYGASPQKLADRVVFCTRQGNILALWRRWKKESAPPFCKSFWSWCVEDPGLKIHPQRTLRTLGKTK